MARTSPRCATGAGRIDPDSHAQRPSLNILVVNAGSSTLKLSLLDGTDGVLASTVVEGWAGGAEAGGVRSFLKGAPAVSAVGHRVVHGGPDFSGAVIVDDRVEASIEALTALAPLHQPRALAGIRVLRRLLPDTPSVATFDTAFHATMPAAATTYALPAEWNRRWGLRRYGFHGLSHAYAARRAAAMLARAQDGLRLVTCHLGAGASLCAIVEGRSVDTTMGFTPVEGVVMATRSGSVDPGLVAWLVDQGGITASEVAAALEQRSGLAGLTGTSDMRDVLSRAGAGDDVASAALDTYVHRLAREAGAMVASAGGVDGLVFTGGIGEHSPAIRAAVASRLRFLGTALDDGANESASGDADIGRTGAAVRTLVVTAREDLEIAAQVRGLLSEAGGYAYGP